MIHAFTDKLLIMILAAMLENLSKKHTTEKYLWQHFKCFNKVAVHLTTKKNWFQKENLNFNYKQ